MSDNTPKGPIAADRKPDQETNPLDKPSKGEDDFATDEMVEKPIRGPEGHRKETDGAGKGDG